MADLLLLVVGDVSPRRLHDAIAARRDPPARVHVVAPALVRPLDWLATAEDDARREAEVRALAAEWSLADGPSVGGGAGEADPVQAVADALRGFPADEILIAGDAADADLEAALAGFGLPVGRLEPTRPPRRSPLHRAARALAAGRSPATPFVLFVGVNGALLLLSVLLSLLVLLVLRLAGEL